MVVVHTLGRDDVAVELGAVQVGIADLDLGTEIACAIAAASSGMIELRILMLCTVMLCVLMFCACKSMLDYR